MNKRHAVLALLCLALASLAPAQTIIFSEDFEGAFPGPWTVGDSNPSGTLAYWQDVDSFFGSPYPHSGNWSGYCAGFGYAGTPATPSYRGSMNAYMRRTVDLTGFTSATLTFWFNIPSIEFGYDGLSVMIDQTELVFLTDATFGWEQYIINLDGYIGGSHSLSFVFVSDNISEEEGAYLDDIVLTGLGGTQPQNLTPHQPAGWSDKLVVSKVTGTTTDSTNLNAGETLYLDWAVINNGPAAINSTFEIELSVDGVSRTSWSSSSLGVNAYTYLQDYTLGSFTAGTHTLRIRADSTAVITESNETDNDYTKTIVVIGTPDIRIAPVSLSFTVTNSGGQTARSFAAESSSEPEPGPIALSSEQKLLAASVVVKRFDAGEQDVPVIINLASPAGKPHGRDWDNKPKAGAWRRAIILSQDDVLANLDRSEFELRHRFENQSAFSATVTRKGFEKLVRDPKVASIEPVHPLQPQLAQGIPLINGMVYRSTYNGSGVAVAIVDSGVDYRHARLGGGAFPNSKVIGGYDFGDNDADPLPNADAHGTACAGIAAGDLGTVGDYIGGVAPGARIYALKITGSDGSAYDDDIIAAWNWCVTHKIDDPANPILVISTSFGGDRYFSSCDSAQSAFATAANNAVAAGLAIFASSGNNGYCDSMSSPACISSVISVGGVFDSSYGTSTVCVDSQSCATKTPSGSCPTGWSAQSVTASDKVAPYSSTASFLTLLAPAHRAYTTDIIGSGGYSSDDYNQSFGGTSAACPYAAGAAAALQSAARSTLGRFLLPAEVRQILSGTGDPVTDTKVAITTPRVNLGRGIERLGQNASFAIFNDGNATLNVTSMALDFASSWLSWTPGAPFSIAPGSAQIVALSVNASLAPLGPTTRRLIVTSDDPDESPYPNAVFLNVTNVDIRPRLVAARANNKVVLSWTTNATGFRLQSASEVFGATWQDVTDDPAVVAGQKFVTNSTAPGRGFYRLRR